MMLLVWHIYSDSLWVPIFFCITTSSLSGINGVVKCTRKHGIWKQKNLKKLVIAPAHCSWESTKQSEEEWRPSLHLWKQKQNSYLNDKGRRPKQCCKINNDVIHSAIQKHCPYFELSHLIDCKFNHQAAPLALVKNLATRWSDFCYLNKSHLYEPVW